MIKQSKTTEQVNEVSVDAFSLSFTVHCLFLCCHQHSSDTIFFKLVPLAGTMYLPMLDQQKVAVESGRIAHQHIVLIALLPGMHLHEKDPTSFQVYSGNTYCNHTQVESNYSRSWLPTLSSCESKDSLAFVGAGRVHGIHVTLCPSLLLGMMGESCDVPDELADLIHRYQIL